MIRSTRLIVSIHLMSKTPKSDADGQHSVEKHVQWSFLLLIYVEIPVDGDESHERSDGVAGILRIQYISRTRFLQPRSTETGENCVRN